MFDKPEIQIYSQYLRYLLLMCLFVISCGSIAKSDRNISNKVCSSQNDSRIIYVDSTATGNNNGLNWKNAYHKLSDALELADATDGPDEIRIAAGIYTENNSSNSTFMLPDNTTIIGSYKRSNDSKETILAGGENARHVLFLDSIKNASISHLTIRGGRATGNLNADVIDGINEVRGGGVLSINSNLNICKVKFINNRAKKFGGAIYAEGGELKIINAYFKKNIVSRGDDIVHNDVLEADTDGGAIAIHNANLLHIRNSTFEENVAGDDGAAFATRKTDVEVIKSNFIRNRAIGLVAAVALPSFTDDFITSTGGAVAIQNEYIAEMGGNQSRTVSIKESRFIENKSAIGGAGFILGAPGSRTILENNRFLGNGGNGIPDPDAPFNEREVTYGRGAAAFLMIGLRGGDRETDDRGNFLRPLHYAVIKESHFENNESGYSGGLVLIGLDADVEKNIFRNNTGRTRGGALLTQNFVPLIDQASGLPPVPGYIRVVESVFEGNRTLGILETLQVENFPGIASVSEQPFGGGAISNDQWGNLVVKNSRFINNTTTNSDGGAIHNATSPISFYGTLTPPAPVTYASNLLVEDSIFVDNKTVGSGSGGAIANGGNQVNGAIIDASGTDLRNIAEHSKLIIKDSVFRNNQSVNDGGAIVNWNGSDLTVIANRFLGNEAVGIESKGGAIATLGHEVNQASVFIFKNKFSRNRAMLDGGGIFASFTKGLVIANHFNSNQPNNIVDVSGTLIIPGNFDNSSDASSVDGGD